MTNPRWKPHLWRGFGVLLSTVDPWGEGPLVMWGGVHSSVQAIPKEGPNEEYGAQKEDMYFSVTPLYITGCLVCTQSGTWLLQQIVWSGIPFVMQLGALPQNRNAGQITLTLFLAALASNACVDNMTLRCQRLWDLSCRWGWNSDQVMAWSLSAQN